jgi:hypothetical protein
VIADYFERFREWLAFKIYPEMHIYIKVARVMGELNENDKIVELIEQSKFKNKKAIVDLVGTKYVGLDSLKQTLDDASEDQTSSDAS